MLTQEKIDKFYKDVENLGLKKPVAAIMRATGDDKSNVSKYLSKKLEPSEEFIKRFYEKFGSSIKVVSRETAEISYNTKEDILRMLDKSLDANTKHASANEKNANSLIKLVELLSLQINSTETGEASEVFEEKGIVRRDPVEYIPGFLDKPEIHLSPKKKEKQKDIASGKRK